MGGGQTPGRGPADRKKGGNEGGKSQGRDIGDQEEEERAQLDPGHSHDDGHDDEGMAADSRGPTNGGGAGDGGARGGEKEPTSQEDVEDPGVWGGAESSGDRGGDPEIHGRVTKEELAGGRSPTEPVGRSDEAQPEERSPEAMVGRHLTKVEPEG